MATLNYSSLRTPKRVMFLREEEDDEKRGGGRQKWNLNYRAPSLVLKFCASAAST